MLPKSDIKDGGSEKGNFNLYKRKKSQQRKETGYTYLSLIYYAKIQTNKQHSHLFYFKPKKKSKSKLTKFSFLPLGQTNSKSK